MQWGILFGRGFRGFLLPSAYCLLWVLVDRTSGGEPDFQELSDKHDAYVALTDPVVPFTIGTLEFVQQQLRLPGEGRFSGVAHLPQQAEAKGQMLSLDRRWFACEVKSHGRVAWIEKPKSPIKGGMSGSPILGPDGAAIAAVSPTG